MTRSGEVIRESSIILIDGTLGVDVNPQGSFAMRRPIVHGIAIVD